MSVANHSAAHTADHFNGRDGSILPRWPMLEMDLPDSALVWVIVKNCVEISGLAVIVIVDALSVRNTVEGSSVCVMFKIDVSAD